MRASYEDEIVGPDQHQRENQPRGASTAARTHAKRHAEQGKYHAGSRKGNATLKFDASVTPVGTTVREELGDGSFRVGDRDILSSDGGLRKIDGNFTLPKGGHIVMRGFFGVVFVLAALAEIQFNLILGRAIDDLRVLGQCDAIGRGGAR